MRRVFLILGQRVCGYVLEKVRYGKSVEIAKVPCEVLFECCLLRVIGISDCMPGLQYCSLRSPLPRTIAHTGLCGGEGKCTHQAHEMIQLATKWLVLCNPDPGGVAVSSCQIRIELIYLQSDDSRPGDLYAMPGGHHAKDAAMDIMISSTRSQSCLQQSSTSSDYALRKTENTKFTKDLRNNEPVQLSATQRLIPLTMNQCGRRGPYFDSMLRDFASLLIRRSSGCILLQGPFALPPTVALVKVLSCLRSRLT